jgi:hypothetical protein
VTALNKVDLPTLGSPTIPAFNIRRENKPNRSQMRKFKRTWLRWVIAFAVFWI